MPDGLIKFNVHFVTIQYDVNIAKNQQVYSIYIFKVFIMVTWKTTCYRNKFKHIQYMCFQVTPSMNFKYLLALKKNDFLKRENKGLFVHRDSHLGSRLFCFRNSGLCGLWRHIVTGTSEWCNMKSLTTPSTVLRSFPCPRLPQTIMSAPTSLAIFIITSPGFPPLPVLTSPVN